MNIIVDTSVWSLTLRRNNPNREVQRLLTRFIEENRVLVPGIIKQELLSGIRQPPQFAALVEQLDYFPQLLATNDDHTLAAKFFNECQNAGIQGSHIDFLIVAHAVNHAAAILTTDKDFESYRKIITFDLTLLAL
ncbi:MAG: PIN domain-containing protein [Spirochaetes bacterium]|nr:PIN domain-containing protein [Spirochaetota bacterium]